MHRALILAALLVFATAAVAEGDFYKGMAAYKSGDYEAAAAEWRSLASQGNPDAQYFLARMYYRGEIDQDDTLAAQWYRKAALKGHAMAQSNLGMLYEQGRGVDQDFDEAVKWYRQAAARALPTAQFNLGRAYDAGRGVEQDGRLAAKWYRQAADQGHLKAQIRLALMYDRGQGVAADPEVAANWYRAAAKQDHGPSAATLGSMYEHGRGVSRNAKKAAKWYSRASALGVTTRPRRAPVATEAVEPAVEAPVAKVVTTAKVEPAAEKPTAEPPEKKPSIAPVADQAPVAEPPHRETPIAKTAVESPPAPPVAPPRVTEPAIDPPPAPPAIEPAADDLDWEIELEAPEIPERDPAEQGDPEAQYRLAQRYNTGQGVQRNLQEAGRWYLEAANRGHGLAGYKLAFLYLKGQATADRDYIQAHKWFSLSADRGVGDAHEWRDKIAKKMTAEELALSASLVREWRITP